MPGLLSGGKALKGTTGSNSIFITLEGAQPSLGLTPSTQTGFTLVTGANGIAGQLGFTSTLGFISFNNGIVQRTTSGTNLVLQSNGTGTVRLSGNVEIDSQLIFATNAQFTNLRSTNSTITNLTVTGAINFTSATNTATFAGDVRMQQDLRVDEQFSVLGNVSLSPEGGIVDIRPLSGGSVLIRPGDTGRMDNMNIGDIVPANGRFVSLTATNFTVEQFTVENQNVNTGTFNFIRILSTGSDSLTAVGGIQVGGVMSATVVLDSGTRVISRVIAGTGLSGGGNGPTVTLNNTGVLSAIAGTDISVNTATGNVTISNTSTLDSVTSRGSTTTNAIYAGQLYDNGVRVISNISVGSGIAVNTSTGPSVVLTNTGVLSLIAGTDTRVSSATGNVTVWNASTLQSVTDRGSTTTNRIRIANGFSQVGTGTSLDGGTWTNAVFIVDGDAGVGGNLYIQGDFYAAGKAVLTTSTLGGSLNQGQDITITTNTSTGEITWDNVSTLQSVTGRGNTTTNRVLFLNTANSTSSTTGAITVAGGVGIAKDVYVGQAIYAQDGGSPAYNYKVYTPQVTVSTSTPVGSRIGDFWIDPSIGIEYQYVPNGTQTVWIQFIGF
jgi:hypothetical protein